MKKQVIISGAVLAVALTFLGAGIVSAAETSAAPQKEIIIAGKKPARFSHPVHLGLGLDCASCHHNGQHEPLDNAAIGAMEDHAALKCVSCHNSSHPDEELQTAKKVFHAKCQTCHKEGLGGKNGPTKCTGCHLKKKGYEGC